MFRTLLFLYNLIFIPLSMFALVVVSCFNQKIRRGLAGRIHLFCRIKAGFPKNNSHTKILFHVSSYGEFLQAFPVMERLKQQHPQTIIIVTVFSPSGYENIQLKPPVDYLYYLPIDSYWGMKKFVRMISPRVAIIVRHDIWPNFVWRLKLEKIPLLLIDASFANKTAELGGMLKLLNRNLLSQFSAIYPISDRDAKQFAKFVDKSVNIQIMGDTKYDQVYIRSQFSERYHQLRQHSVFKKRKIIVAGSTWLADEAQILPAFREVAVEEKSALLIIAPHEPTQKRVAEIESRCEKLKLTTLRLTRLNKHNIRPDCIIVDQIGLLANLYALGMAAFVGGSFYDKVHNVLEPAVYGIPVFFGPRISNSVEAATLLENDAAEIVRSSDDIKKLLQKVFRGEQSTKQLGENARRVVKENVGSSEKIAAKILDHIKSLHPRLNG
ncbi:MAG TPA: 3-deoxy-D-manno-octulosonic acid transferase [bacterium]|nr:3-deoxy-D-manno-octulosonic acid transferase [bacterium]